MTDYEQAYRDLRAGVEALADEWDGYGHGVYCTHLEDQLPCGTCTVLARIRALLASSAPATASEDAAEELRRAVGVRLAQEFERKNASQKPDAFMADTWLFAADTVLDVIAARPTREEFRARVRSILVDRAALDEHIEEFFDEVLDDIVEAHLSHPTLATGVTSSDGDRGLSEEWDAAHDLFCPRSRVCSTHGRPGERHLLAARTAQSEGVERVEWGVRHPQGIKECRSEKEAREAVAEFRRRPGRANWHQSTVVRRRVGPWEVVGDE